MLVGVSAVSNALGLAGSLFVLQVYDRVLATRSGFALAFLGLVFGGMVVAAGVLEWLRQRALVRLGNRTARDATAAARRGLEASSGRIGAADNAAELPDALRKGLASPAGGAIFDLPWTPIYVVALTIIHPAIGVAVVVLGMLMLAFARAANAGSVRAGQAALAATQREAALAGAVARVAPLFMARGATARLFATSDHARTSAWAADTALSDRQAALAHASRTLRQLVQFVILGAAAWLAVRNEVTIGAVFAASILAGRALVPIETLAAQRGAARDALEAVRRCWWNAAAPEERSGPAPVAVSAHRVEASHAYAAAVPSGRLALHDINVAAAGGDVLGIMGPVGAGKSTLLRLLLGAVRPVTGTVSLNGVPLGSAAAADQHAIAGWLEQVPAFVPGSVASNIASLDDAATRESVLAACNAAGLMPHAGRWPEGLDTVIDAQGLPLTAGERQLVALARALYGDPVLLALDLPESHLGPDEENVVARAVAAAAGRGAIVLLVSHSPRLLRHATRIALLSEGRIARILSPHELIAPVREGRDAGRIRLERG